jgi:hypothetical protein
MKVGKEPACLACGAPESEITAKFGIKLTPAGFCLDWNACDERRKAKAFMTPARREQAAVPAAPVPLRARVWIYTKMRQHYFRRVVIELPASQQCGVCGQMRVTGEIASKHEHLELVPDPKDATVFTGEEASALARDWGARLEAV